MNHVGLRGRYKLQVLDASRERVLRETDWIPNLITDIGLDRIGDLGSVGQWMRIGTGNTAPAFGNTDLVSPAAATSNLVGQSNGNAGAPDYETISSSTYEFALGAVNGNMAEIGVGWASSGATLFSRALILDGGGSPTTLPVSSSEILRATYEITGYPTLTDATGSVTVTGSGVHGYTARPSNVDQDHPLFMFQPWLGGGALAVFAGGIGATTAAPSGSSGSMSFVATASYTPGSHYLDHSFFATIDAANVAGDEITSMRFAPGVYGTFPPTQVEFSPPIPKDATQTLAMVFRQSWGRA